VTECERFAAAASKRVSVRTVSQQGAASVCVRDDDKLEYYDFVERQREGKKAEGKKTLSTAAAADLLAVMRIYSAYMIL